MARKLKTYSAELSVRGDALCTLMQDLTGDRTQTRARIFAVAGAKADAIELLRQHGWNYVEDRDLRVAYDGRTDLAALDRAGLLDEPGVLLLHETAEGRGQPVILPDVAGEPAVIGRLQPRESDSGYAFAPALARYCADGSVVAGSDYAYIKDGGRWYGTATGSETDAWVDEQISRGELDILRAGRGRFGKE